MRPLTQLPAHSYGFLFIILVDTSVWIDHLRSSDDKLATLLHDSLVLIHPFVVGEPACGNLRDRESVLGLLQALPFLAHGAGSCLHGPKSAADPPLPGTGEVSDG